MSAERARGSCLTCAAAVHVRSLLTCGSLMYLHHVTTCPLAPVRHTQTYRQPTHTLADAEGVKNDAMMMCGALALSGVFGYIVGGRERAARRARRKAEGKRQA